MKKKQKSFEFNTNRINYFKNKFKLKFRRKSCCCNECGNIQIKHFFTFNSFLEENKKKTKIEFYSVRKNKSKTTQENKSRTINKKKSLYADSKIFI